MSKLPGLIVALVLVGCGVAPPTENTPNPPPAAAAPAQPGAQPELSHNGWCYLQYQECAAGADKCDQCLCKNELALCTTPPGHVIDCSAQCDSGPLFN